MSISTYLHIAKSLANELALAGRAVSQAEFNVIIYRNIGAKFHLIILALNMCTEPISFKELHSQLVAHETLLQSVQEIPQAYVSYRPSPRPFQLFHYLIMLAHLFGLHYPTPLPLIMTNH